MVDVLSDSSIDPWTGLSAARLGLYVHFPWCLAKCPYCDFAVAVARNPPEARYAEAIRRELTLRLAASVGLAGRALDSVYFGGGTPSLWDSRHVAAVLEDAARRFALAPEAEVTLEANPETVTRDSLEAYRSAGVNRLSLGVQSLDAGVLARLGRAHRAPEARAAVEAARDAGFDNVSVDLIFGVEGQTVAEATGDARGLTALGPEHVSAYLLTVDRESLAEETVFARRLARGELQLPPDARLVEMMDAVADVLEASGFERYEISSYARPGWHARHNALYWTGGEYLGLGVGATGTLRTPAGAVRTNALRSPEKYLAAVEAGALPDATRESLGPRDLFAERLMLGLRLRGGIDLDALCAAFGEPSREDALSRLVAAGCVERVEGRVRLTRRGTHLHSEVSARLL